MRLHGIELKGFRNIGNEAVILTPLNRCNILIGQNNSGKSNILKGISLLSDRINNQNKISFSELDVNNRDKEKPFIYKLWFELDTNSALENQIYQVIKEPIIWFEFSWSEGNNPKVIDYLFANISDFGKSNKLLEYLYGQTWSSQMSEKEIKSYYLGIGNNIYTRHFAHFPMVHIIPEFRQIRQGDEYSLDGKKLIDHLSKLQSPEIGKDKDQEIFYKIQEFLRMLIDLPNAEIEISRDNPTIIINNNKLRLPLSAYGTGVHELLILITAVLSINDSICCIEEPEIHLYPKLQNKFLEFIIQETTNQYFISTHSAIIINNLVRNPNVQVFHIVVNNGLSKGRPVIDNKSTAEIINDLGLNISDLLQANCIIWVEGPTDRIYIRHFIKLLNDKIIEGRDYIFLCYRQLPRLSIDIENIDEELVNVLQINRNAIVIMDSDLRSKKEELSQAKKDINQNCAKNGGYCWITDGKEIENYLPDNSIIKMFKDIRKVDINFKNNLFENVSEIIDKALIASDSTPINYDNNKPELSRKIIEYIQESDLSGILRERINQIISKILEWK